MFKWKLQGFDINQCLHVSRVLPLESLRVPWFHRRRQHITSNSVALYKTKWHILLATVWSWGGENDKRRRKFFTLQGDIHLFLINKYSAKLFNSISFNIHILGGGRWACLLKLKNIELPLSILPLPHSPTLPLKILLSPTSNILPLQI